MVVSSVVAGQLLSRTGKYRVLGIVGMILLTGGMFLLSTMNVEHADLADDCLHDGHGPGPGRGDAALHPDRAERLPDYAAGRGYVGYHLLPLHRRHGGVAILGRGCEQSLPGEIWLRCRSSSLNSQSACRAGYASKLNPQALVNPQAIEGISRLSAPAVPAAAGERHCGRHFDGDEARAATATTEAFLIGGATLIIAIVATALLKEIPLRKTNERPGAGDG